MGKITKETVKMAKASEARLRANAKYDAENALKVGFKFNKKTDPDIIEKLESVENKQAYIKKLIREDIAKTKSDLST